MYDPQLGRWHTQDVLSEYHLNYTPYHYTFNNPINFIDPFGLDTTYVIPEVVVTYTPPSKPTSNFTSLLYAINRLLEGNHNPSKIHDATRFDNWLIRTFDMSEVKRLGEIFGRPGFEGTNNNKVRSNESYQGRTEDKEIIETSAGNNKEIIENNPLVKKYKGFDWSSWKQVKDLGDNIELYNDASGDSAAIIYGNIDSIKVYAPHTKRNNKVMSREIIKTYK